MMTRQIIYIKILNEEVDVYIPVIGKQIAKNLFLISNISYKYQEENLEFTVGEKVFIKSKMLTNGRKYKNCKVAISKNNSIKQHKAKDLKIYIHPKTKKLLICNEHNEIIHVGGDGFRYEV